MDISKALHDSYKIKKQELDTAWDSLNRAVRQRNVTLAASCVGLINEANGAIQTIDRTHFQLTGKYLDRHNENGALGE